MRPGRLNQILTISISWARARNAALWLVAAFAGCAAVAGLVWAWYTHTRVTAEATTVFLLLTAVRAVVVAKRRSDLTDSEIENRAAAMAAPCVRRAEEAEAAALTTTAALSEREAAIVALTEQLEARVAAAHATGLVIAAAQSWLAATKSKKAPVTVGDTVIDADYWWARFTAAVTARWPGREWPADELLELAENLSGVLTPARWNTFSTTNY